MSSRRSERPRKRPTPIDAHYEESLVSAALPRSASASASTSKMTDESSQAQAGPSQVRAKTRGKARSTKASRRKRPMGEEEVVENGAVREEEDGPVVDDERDSLRGSVRPGTKEDPEEEEDPVWQEFSQEYYEVVEQLPLEIHRNFALLRELDDQTQRHTGQLLELIRKYVVRRLPSPVPEELEVPLPVVPPHGEVDSGEIKGTADGDGESHGGEMKMEPSNGAAVGAGVNGEDVAEVDGHSMTTTNGQVDPVPGGKTTDVDSNGPQEGESTVPPDSATDDSADVPVQPVPYPGEDSTLQEPATPTVPLAETTRAMDVASANGRDEKPPIAGRVPPSLNGTQPQQSPTKTISGPDELEPTSTQRVDTLKARQAEMYAHRLVPAMASRDLLPGIGKLARDMLRSADEKVGIAIGTYNTVDRHIRSLDAALQAQQAALNLGIRQDTLPSKAVTGGTTDPEGEPSSSSMLQAGGKADTSVGVGAEPAPRVGKNARRGMKGYHGDQTRAVDALDVGLTTTMPLVDKKTGKQKSTTAVKVVGEPEPIVLGYMAAHNFDLAIDPNEPRYCFCQNVSYGEMVGCENLDCPNGGWFHLGCLGMTSAPTGKWWCDQCKPTDKASGQKRKKRKIKF